MKKEEKRDHGRFRNMPFRNTNLKAENRDEQNVKDQLEPDSIDDEGYISFFSFQEFQDKLQSQDRKQARKLIEKDRKKAIKQREILKQSEEKKARALLDSPTNIFYKSLDYLNISFLTRHQAIQSNEKMRLMQVSQAMLDIPIKKCYKSMENLI